MASVWGFELLWASYIQQTLLSNVDSIPLFNQCPLFGLSIYLLLKIKVQVSFGLL